MPQDKRRTINYRSFVTCNDPKGIECGAIRKSKINSQKKEQDTSKIEVDTNKEKNQNTSISLTTIKKEKEKKEMVIRGITRGKETSPLTFQLLEVSKETTNLNHVINSWSNTKKLKEGNNQNNNIAKDLLKGALDLQESLNMLGKLQEASSFMLGMSKKNKQTLEEGTFDGMVSGVRGIEKSQMNRRYFRNSIDEMRSVVRDSLLRENNNVMITNPVFEENYCYGHRKMIASPDIMLPSTSSSQSSMVYSSNFGPSDSSISSSTNTQLRKVKDSNLIFKLMGLESFPSSPRRNSNSEKERDKILNLAKPVYDNDSPRAKRPQFGGQETGMKQRSVDEILENLKFKGLLRNNSHESDVFCPENSSMYERTPIVLMKPIRYPFLDLDGPYMPKFWGENIMNERHSREFAQDTVKKGTEEFHYEEKSKYNKKAVSNKVKGCVNSQPILQKKQGEVKKANEVEKVTPIRRKGEEKKNAKSSDHLNSRDQEKCNTLKIKRQEDGKSVSKNQTSSQPPNIMLDKGKRGTSERKKNRKPGLAVEDKRICEGTKKKREVIHKEDSDSRGDSDLVLPSISSIIVADNEDPTCQIPIRDYDIDTQTKLFDTQEELSYLPIDKKSSHYDDNQSSYSEITSVITSEHSSADQIGEIQSPLREVTLITTHENGVEVHHNTIPKCFENSINSPQENDSLSLRQCVCPRMKLKALLLSNTTWTNRVEEIFDIQVNLDLAQFVINDDDYHDLESPRLLVDCANEFLELKSSQFPKSRSPPSLDRLLEEVCNGIEDLRCYSKPIINDFPSDNLYALLERDLRVKSGIWGIGWRNMYTQDEIEQVVGDVDRFVFSKLIEEVLTDFVK